MTGALTVRLSLVVRSKARASRRQLSSRNTAHDVAKRQVARRMRRATADAPRRLIRRRPASPVGVRFRRILRAFCSCLRLDHVHRRQLVTQPAAGPMQPGFDRAMARAQVGGNVVVTPLFGILQQQDFRVAIAQSSQVLCAPVCPRSSANSHSSGSAVRRSRSVGRVVGESLGQLRRLPCLRRYNKTWVTASRYSQGATLVASASGAR